MNYIVDNLRLKELIFIVKQNSSFYYQFIEFLNAQGYATLYDFINEESDEKAEFLIISYLNSDCQAKLLDGIGREYHNNKAKWYFLAWVLRDAPAQRLEKLLTSVQGKSKIEKQANLLNQVRKFIAPLFPEADSWTWAAISEVMLARLEGSRRALKGVFIQNVVRLTLKEIFENYQINLQLSDKEIKLNEESYDIQLLGNQGRILIPVKTRETMGGGHASLFTRDIFKSISVARENGYDCLPIIIAESWSGNLNNLPCEHYILLSLNPNQIEQVKISLYEELIKLIDIFLALE